MNIQQRKKKEIASEERYLLRRGWKVERHYELAEGRDWRSTYDLHTWIAPRAYVNHGTCGKYTTPKGGTVSRMGALSMQCSEDGHRKPMNYKGPMNMPLVVCSRCRAAFGIGRLAPDSGRAAGAALPRNRQRQNIAPDQRPPE